MTMKIPVSVHVILILLGLVQVCNIAKEQFFFEHSIVGENNTTTNHTSIPPTSNFTSNEKGEETQDALAGLFCEKYGGPNDELATQEMVYWQDIPTDATSSEFVSPFKRNDKPAGYLSFEPDLAGWNNVRMCMETALVIAMAMGRTLVLPNRLEYYRLNSRHNNQQNQFTFADFFPLWQIQQKFSTGNGAFDMIPMEEFLRREQGNFVDKQTQQPSPLPYNRTNWDVNDSIPMTHNRTILYRWLRSVTTTIEWFPPKCVAAFPFDNTPQVSNNRLQTIFKTNSCCSSTFSERQERFIQSGPIPVDSPSQDRLEEIIAHRNQELCLYDAKQQAARFLHITNEQRLLKTEDPHRMLVPFYAFVYFENWKQDLWVKRFVRDHLRYVDEIQCAAARIVVQLRTLAKQHGNFDGHFHTLHIHGPDFQMFPADQQLSTADLYDNIRQIFEKEHIDKINATTVYIATDLPPKQHAEYFKLLTQRYHVYFLNDFMNLIPELNTNFYPMLDQLIAAKGHIFVGTYLSSFTAYINRLRGYFSQRDRIPGYKRGLLLHSYLVNNNNNKDGEYNHKYHVVQQPFFAHEFPISWRDLDHGIIVEP